LSFVAINIAFLGCGVYLTLFVVMDISSLGQLTVFNDKECSVEFRCELYSYAPVAIYMDVYLMCGRYGFV
jgi:hypothetical protein